MRTRFTVILLALAILPTSVLAWGGAGHQLIAAEAYRQLSPEQRAQVIEVHERIARKFVEELLTAEPGNILLLADAYAVFLKLAKQQSLGPVKRSEFKAMMVPLIQEQFNVCLRNDLVVDERSGVRGWKNMRLQTLPT